MQSALVLLSAVAPVLSDVVLSRTVDMFTVGKMNVTIEGGACTSTDKYGSNNCDLKWGSKYKVDIDGSLAKDLPAGTTVQGDITIDGLLPFKFDCKVCGENCTVAVPMLRKNITLPTPTCPIHATALKTSFDLPLPAKPSVPLEVGFDGTLTLKDPSGTVLIKMDVKGDVAPTPTVGDLDLEPSPAVSEVESAYGSSDTSATS